MATTGTRNDATTRSLGTSASDLRRPVLTAEGRALLEQRIAGLAKAQDDLRPLIVDHERDARFADEFDRLQIEIDHLRGVLASAAALPKAPRGVVCLGSRVTLRGEDGARFVVRIVDPVEATLDDERISVQSPLAQVLLGARAKAQVEVPAPSGSWTCTVVSVSHPKS